MNGFTFLARLRQRALPRRLSRRWRSFVRLQAFTLLLALAACNLTKGRLQSVTDASPQQRAKLGEVTRALNRIKQQYPQEFHPIIQSVQARMNDLILQPAVGLRQGAKLFVMNSLPGGGKTSFVKLVAKAIQAGENVEYKLVTSKDSYLNVSKIRDYAVEDGRFGDIPTPGVLLFDEYQRAYVAPDPKRIAVPPLDRVQYWSEATVLEEIEKLERVKEVLAEEMKQNINNYSSYQSYYDQALRNVLDPALTKLNEQLNTRKREEDTKRSDVTREFNEAKQRMEDSAKNFELLWQAVGDGSISITKGTDPGNIKDQLEKIAVEFSQLEKRRIEKQGAIDLIKAKLTLHELRIDELNEKEAVRKRTQTREREVEVTETDNNPNDDLLNSSSPDSADYNPFDLSPLATPPKEEEESRESRTETIRQTTYQEEEVLNQIEYEDDPEYREVKTKLDRARAELRGFEDDAEDILKRLKPILEKFVEFYPTAHQVLLDNHTKDKLSDIRVPAPVPDAEALAEDVANGAKTLAEAVAAGDPNDPYFTGVLRRAFQRILGLEFETLPEKLIHNTVSRYLPRYVEAISAFSPVEKLMFALRDNPKGFLDFYQEKKEEIVTAKQSWAGNVFIFLAGNVIPLQNEVEKIVESPDIEQCNQTPLEYLPDEPGQLPDLKRDPLCRRLVVESLAPKYQEFMDNLVLGVFGRPNEGIDEFEEHVSKLLTKEDFENQAAFRDRIGTIGFMLPPRPRGYVKFIESQFLRVALALQVLFLDAQASPVIEVDFDNDLVHAVYREVVDARKGFRNLVDVAGGFVASYIGSTVNEALSAKVRCEGKQVHGVKIGLQTGKSSNGASEAFFTTRVAYTSSPKKYNRLKSLDEAVPLTEVDLKDHAVQQIHKRMSEFAVVIAGEAAMTVALRQSLIEKDLEISVTEKGRLERVFGPIPDWAGTLTTHSDYANIISLSNSILAHLAGVVAWDLESTFLNASFQEVDTRMRQSARQLRDLTFLVTKIANSYYQGNTPKYPLKSFLEIERNLGGRLIPLNAYPVLREVYQWAQQRHSAGKNTFELMTEKESMGIIARMRTDNSSSSVRVIVIKLTPLVEKFAQNIMTSYLSVSNIEQYQTSFKISTDRLDEMVFSLEEESLKSDLKRYAGIKEYISFEALKNNRRGEDGFPSCKVHRRGTLPTDQPHSFLREKPVPSEVRQLIKDLTTVKEDSGPLMESLAEVRRSFLTTFLESLAIFLGWKSAENFDDPGSKDH